MMASTISTYLYKLLSIAAAQTTEVDTIDLASGELTPFLTGLTKAKGLVWLPGSDGD